MWQLINSNHSHCPRPHHPHPPPHPHPHHHHQHHHHHRHRHRHHHPAKTSRYLPFLGLLHLEFTACVFMTHCTSLRKRKQWLVAEGDFHDVVDAKNEDADDRESSGYVWKRLYLIPQYMV